jgi:nucleoside-diphosphate-sugar epimerase
MRVFVTGATGVVGRRAVARLVAAGHAVTGIARSPEKAALLASLGATGVAVSLFEPDALRAAVAGHDAVVNLATKIPPLAQMPRLSAWAENERIRREGSGNLVDAAIAAGATVFDATTAQPMDGFPSEAVQIAEANVARFTEAGGRGVVLRFGRFYAPESDQTRAMVRLARNGVLMDLGPASSYAPMIAADDAAAAVVGALDAPAGVYDVVDDEALTREQQGRVLARAVGRRRLRHAPSMGTPKMSSYLAASQRVSNRRFREAARWWPAFPSVREGYPALVRDIGIEPALRGWTRLMLWILAFSAFGVGMQAAFFPRSFYDDFPLGRGWVAMDGPYNQHLVRDVGSLNLALVVLVFAALFVGTRTMARTAMLVWLVNAVPHFLYHLGHLSMDMSGGDKFALVATLGFTVLAPIIVLIWTNPPPEARVDAAATLVPATRV